MLKDVMIYQDKLSELMRIADDILFHSYLYFNLVSLTKITLLCVFMLRLCYVVIIFSTLFS